MIESIRTELRPGVHLRCVRTDQFHSGYLALHLLHPLSREDAARNALLMRVLRCGTRRYPSMEKLAVALEELYGAAIGSTIRQSGETVITGFSSIFPDDRFLPGKERTLERMTALASELLLEPATNGGLLDEAFVRSERENLRDQIRAVINDKRRYAALRLRECMCSEEAYGIYPLGSAEDAERITNLSLTRYHQEFLLRSPIEVFYCGSAEYARVEDAVLSAFRALPENGPREYPQTFPVLSCGEPKLITEAMEIEQGKLAMGFRLGSSMLHPNYPALSVFNELFGGGSNSRLFLEVRERRSLCYSVGSSLESHKGILTVMAGIACDKREETVDAVLTELNCCAEGSFDEEDLQTARGAVASSCRMALDDPSRICSFYLNQDLLGQSGDLHHYAALAEEVTAEQIQSIASEVKLDTIYFLQKQEATAHE